MRFVAVKSIEQQAGGMTFRTRDLFVRQKTQTINALRGHLAEYGVIAPKGVANLRRLVQTINDPDSGLPDLVIELGLMLLSQIAELQQKIDGLDRYRSENA